MIQRSRIQASRNTGIRKGSTGFSSRRWPQSSFASLVTSCTSFCLAIMPCFPSSTSSAPSGPQFNRSEKLSSATPGPTHTGAHLHLHTRKNYTPPALGYPNRSRLHSPLTWLKPQTSMSAEAAIISPYLQPKVQNNYRAQNPNTSRKTV
jgi:hypothetical protein